MTYGPVVEQTRLPRWRIVLVVIACLVGPPVSVFLGFWGAITYSGCFISCGDAQPVLGAALLAAALALLLSGPVLAGLLLRRASAVAFALLGVVASGFGLVGLATVGG